MTELIDIYEAAGCKVSDDRRYVEPSSDFQPFDIVLRVVPIEVRFDENRKGEVTFKLLLRSEHVRNAFGGPNLIDYDIDLTLPVNQIRILKNEPKENS